MTSVFDLLDDVRKRPSMFVGWDEWERRRQLEALESMLFGYQRAVVQHGLDDPGRALLTGFGDYLQARFGWSMSCGPIGAILEHSPTEQEAWTRFWVLLDDYKRDRGVGNPGVDEPAPGGNPDRGNPDRG